ncbi:hypothetical protein [Pseudomonas fluorescens]|uniref:Uncharacterized protein n=1 Tax=Pseudomonas fluorescens TaxID=294 RepID=A0A5E7Q433_PSEFL|nr:hypothetical protein [Pseudomonas fluorescens]VVP56581.1 hypothetical protein PS880_05737 [Pseudomonas fluorescens]
MNSLAQQALDRAQHGAPPTQKLFPPIVANEPLPDLVITGPINRVMELEGKRHALEVVRSYGANIRRPDIAAKAIRNLTMTALAQPSSYASGIKQVIDLLQVET